MGEWQWLTFPFPFVHSPSFSEHIFVEDRIKDYQPVETRTQDERRGRLSFSLVIGREIWEGRVRRRKREGYLYGSEDRKGMSMRGRERINLGKEMNERWLGKGMSMRESNERERLAGDYLLCDMKRLHSPKPKKAYRLRKDFPSE